MAQESCNLDKDEAEILKPSSSSSPPPPPPAPAASSPPALFMKTPQEHPVQRSERREIPAAEPGGAESCARKAEEESQPEPGISTAYSGASGCIQKTEKQEQVQKPPVRSINRCSSCRKRVGLTGFRCRCGDLFCGLHRYSDTHDCSFDYKAVGREEIAKANPVIRAAKIIKI